MKKKTPYKKKPCCKNCEGFTPPNFLYKGICETISGWKANKITRWNMGSDCIYFKWKEEMKEEIKQTEEDYELFGDKWKTGLMEKNKLFLIKYLENALTELKICMAKVKLLEQEKEELEARIKKLEQK